MYLNIIRPAIEYGSVIYDCCTIGDSMRIEQLQRKAAIICLGAMKRTETNKLIDALKWDSLSNRRNLAKLSLFYTIVTGSRQPICQE